MKKTSPPIDDTIRTLADIMDKALTPPDGGNSEAGKQVLRQIFKGAMADFQKNNDIAPSTFQDN